MCFVYNFSRACVLCIISAKLEEGDSDKCMMEIIQPKKTNAKNDNQPSCSMSKDCAQKMTKRGLTEYGITHQLLWSGLAEKVNNSFYLIGWA